MAAMLDAAMMNWRVTRPAAGVWVAGRVKGAAKRSAGDHDRQETKEHLPLENGGPHLGGILDPHFQTEPVPAGFGSGATQYPFSRAAGKTS